MAALSRSVEHAASMSAFRRHFRELAQVIEHQLSSFNAIVYADFLIGEETKVKADPDATLNQIEDCLRNDANVYKRFIEALSMTSSTASVAKVIEDLEKTRAWYLTNASTTKPSQTENEACAFVEAPLEQVRTLIVDTTAPPQFLYRYHQIKTLPWTLSQEHQQQ